MRPIKFRVFSHSMQRMIPVELLDIGFDGRPDNPIAVAEGMMLRQGDIKVMEFAGLLDKNGREIYEGDILRFKSYLGGSTQLSRCVFDNGAFDFKFYPKMNDRYDLEPEHMEVVGNVFENPDLAKEMTEHVE